MASRALWVRWSLRDLRRRWPLVTAIAAVIAIGTAVFASLSSAAYWRRVSNDASYEVTAFHDLQATLTGGATVAEGTLRAVVAALPDPGRVAAAEERLVLPTQVDASAAHPTGRPVLVTGRLVGSGGAGGPAVDRVLVVEGRSPTPSDPATTLLLDLRTARTEGLPPSGSLALAGGRNVTYVGLAQQPEYFLTVGNDDPTGLAGGFAPLYASLRSVQSLTGRAGEVNDLVLRAAPGTDLEVLARDLAAALAASPAAGATVMRGRDHPSYRVLYDDIEGDQQVWNIVSFLVLGGAALAVLNLVSRVVDAQRREFGVGMALGVPARRLAVRPLLLAVEIAALGALAGLGLALLLNRLLVQVFDSVLPLPVWRTPFRPDRFALAAALAVGLPLVAVAGPVRRVARTEPVDALRTVPVAGRGQRMARLVARLPGGRRAWRQLPVRNLARQGRRTALTAVAIGATVTVMVGVLGLLDSFTALVRTAVDELNHEAPDRLDVGLDRFRLAADPDLAAIRTSPLVGSVDGVLAIPVRLGDPDAGGFDAVLSVTDLTAAAWRPTVVAGRLPSAAGEVLVSTNALDDLSLRVGDPVTVRHPVRTGTTYRLVTSSFTVVGTHRLPLRSIVHADATTAGRLNLAGVVNSLRVVPAADADPDAVQRFLFHQPAVASARPVRAAAGAFEEAIAQFEGILRIVAACIVLLAVLIAFNTTSIAVDERRRDHATMFAFGLRVRQVVAELVTEGAVLGVLGTAIGVLGGYAVVRWVTEVVLARTLPDLAVTGTLSGATVAFAVVLGVAAVAASPLLLWRRLRRLDVAAMLRVVE